MKRILFIATTIIAPFLNAESINAEKQNNSAADDFLNFQTKKFENKMTQKPYKIRKSLCKHFCKQYKVGIRANFFIYSIVNGGEIIMADVTVQKRGEVYQYKFEIASIDGKRKFKNKSGFATKSEAKQAGIIAYNEYLNTGHSFKPKTMSYSDYLD